MGLDPLRIADAKTSLLVTVTAMATRPMPLVFVVGTVRGDADNDGICDDVDDCVGAYDAIGVCNGSCEEDLNGNGICDDVDLRCTDGLAQL